MKVPRPLISVVSPIYKGEKMMDELVSRIESSVESFTEDYEIILVNDCSPDDAWNKIKQICDLDKKVKGINLSRNFGQPYAITAGLTYSHGEYVIVLDCDLQNPPEEIPRLYKKAIDEDLDIVYACRTTRADNYAKRMSSTIYHKVYNYLTGLDSSKEIAEFGIYKRNVVSVYCKIPEYSRTFCELVQTLGFRTGTIEVSHDKRAEGESSYTLGRLLSLSFDAMISNSNRPLQLSVAGGFLMAFISLLLNVINVVAGFLGYNEVAGYTTTIFSIWFVGGLLLMMLGILGLYIGKIFDQVKGRPIFIVRDLLNFNKENAE
jgi:dolichol-phosphate mannosyltransferase